MTGNHRNGLYSQWHNMLSVRGSVMALLALYLAAFISSPAGVPHLHHDTNVVHDDSCRKDPCHVAVYHPGDKHHCDHKSHLSAEDEACDLCKISVVPQDLPQVEVFASLDKLTRKPLILAGVTQVTTAVDHLANKGPPSIS